MASETHVLAHSEELEKKAESEVKKVDADDIPASKESLEESPSPPESEEKPVVLPVVDEVKTVDKVEDKPVAAEESRKTVAALLAEERIENELVQPSSADDLKRDEVALPLAELTGENIEDMPVEPHLPEDQKSTELAGLTENKFEDKPVESSPVVGKKKDEDVPIAKPSDKGIQEVTKEAVSELDTVTVAGSAEGKLEDRSEPEQGEDRVEESKVMSVEDNSAKVCDVPAPLPAEEVPVVEVIEDKETIVSVAECKQEAAPVEKVDFQGPQDEVGDVKLVAKEEEINAAESVDQVKSESPVEEKGVECYPAEIMEKIGERSEVGEAEKGSAKVKGSLEETQHTTEGRSSVAEELVPCEEKPSEDAGDVTERGIELSVENRRNKDEAEVVENVEKTEEVVQAVEANLEEEKQGDKITEENVNPTEQPKLEEDEPAKSDVQNSECGKDTAEDDPKKDVPVKTQKPSIVKMMKQSLVKAKKVIIGISQNSRTGVNDAKDDGNK